MMFDWLRSDSVDSLSTEVYSLRNKYENLRQRCCKLLETYSEKEQVETTRHDSRISQIETTYSSSLTTENTKYLNTQTEISASKNALAENMAVAEKVIALFEAN